MNIEKYNKISKEINKEFDPLDADDQDTLINLCRLIGSKIPHWGIQLVLQEKDTAQEGDQMTLAELVHNYGYNFIIVKNDLGDKIAEGYDDLLLKTVVCLNLETVSEAELGCLTVEIVSFYDDMDGFKCVEVKTVDHVIKLNNYDDSDDYCPF